MDKPKHAGRPTTKGREGEKSTLGIRASAALKDRLNASADRNGRSLSQEAEIRLEQSFQNQHLLDQALDLVIRDQRAVAVLMLIGDAMRGTIVATGRVTRSADWIDQPYAFDQVVRAVNRVLECHRPEGDPGLPKTPLIAAGADSDTERLYREIGARVANWTVQSVTAADWRPTSDWLVQSVRDRLGPTLHRLRANDSGPSHGIAGSPMDMPSPAPAEMAKGKRKVRTGRRIK